MLGVRPDPGNLTEFTIDDVGRVLLFEVTGRPDGSVWGTDAYTGDSRLAAAAVHAGALREGERGLVRVTLLDGDSLNYEGSTRHGVQTYDYANYPLALPRRTSLISMDHPDWPAFIAAIIADPDDDTVRLVAADFLEEHGDPDRAAFIRIQVELARLEADGRGQEPRRRSSAREGAGVTRAAVGVAGNYGPRRHAPNWSR